MRPRESPSLALCPALERNRDEPPDIDAFVSLPSADPHFALFSRVIVPEKLFTTYERVAEEIEACFLFFCFFLRVGSWSVCLKCLSNGACMARVSQMIDGSTVVAKNTRVTRQINSFAFEMKRMPISVEKCISTWDSIV